MVLVLAVIKRAILLTDQEYRYSKLSVGMKSLLEGFLLMCTYIKESLFIQIAPKKIKHHVKM